MSGYFVNGVNLDDIFDPYVDGSKPALTGYATGGQDLRDRYAPIYFGSQAALTGYKIIGGADLNTLFAAAGTASYFPPAPWAGKTYSADRIDGQNINAKLTLEFLTSGIFKVYSTVQSVVQIDAGQYLPDGASSADYEIICVLDSGSPLTLNEISSYTQISQNKYVEFEGLTEKSCSITIVARRIGTTLESFGSCFLNLTYND